MAKIISENYHFLDILVKEATKPWYKKPEAWFALVAAITGVILLILEL